MTQKEIAKQLRVSQATVSMALMNSTEISANLREKVHRHVSEHGYYPNLAGQLLRSGRSNMIAVLFNKFSQGFYSELLTELFACARTQKFILLPLEVKARENMESLKRMLKSYNVSGLCAIVSEHQVKHLQELHLPIVPINPVSSFKEESNLSVVSSDLYKSGRILAQYLVKTGCRHIAFAGKVFDHEQRFLGVSTALKEAGLPLVTTIGHSNNFQSGFDAVESILEQQPKTDAIIGHNDEVAMGVIRHLTIKGIPIPEKISVAGFDDIYFAKYCTPALTTVSQHIHKLAATILGVIASMQKQENFTSNTIIPCKLIVRESTR